MCGRHRSPIDEVPEHTARTFGETSSGLAAAMTPGQVVWRADSPRPETLQGFESACNIEAFESRVRISPSVWPSRGP